MKHYESSISIQAPAETVWALLTDLKAYPIWNSTVTKVEGTMRLGAKIKVFAKISPDRAFPVKLATLEAPRLMVWRGGMPLGLFKGVRTFRLDPEAAGVTFSMREAFSGLFSGMITKSMPDLQPAFDQFARDLKQAAESQNS